MQTPPTSNLPPPSGPIALPVPSQSDDRSKWRHFRSLPLLGQLGIWFAIALSVLLGVGIVGAIAAGPEPEVEIVPAVESPPDTTVSATTTSVPSTTLAEATVPATTVVQAAPAVVVPVTDAIVLLTAEVVDGDTISVSDGSTVRLIGIDAPERGQCGSEEASAVLAQLVVGQTITLVPGARDDVDKYGRLLRYVEANGIDTNLMMIQSGHAIARYDGRDGYGSHLRQDAYVAADDLTPSTNACVVVPITDVSVAAVPVADIPVAIIPFADVPVTPAAVHYQNCTEVRTAGAAPIRAGDPGWQSKFDRDGDGVGCE